MCEECEEKSKRDRWCQSRCIVLGWLNLDLDKQAELRACVRACFEKFVRGTCSFVRIRYALAAIRRRARLFSRVTNGGGCARGRLPWQIRYQRHTHRKKKFSPFSRRRAMTSSFREVVSAFFSAYECSLSNAFISIRACGSSGLNYRHARMCFYLSLCVHACACVCMRVCVDVVYMFSVFVRVCDIKVSCREVPSFISQVCHLFSVIMTIFFFSLSFEQRNTSDAFNRSFLTFLSCI